MLVTASIKRISDSEYKITTSDCCTFIKSRLSQAIDFCKTLNIRYIVNIKI